MNRADTLVIVLLLSMIAGFLAVPFTQWLCETIESAFDFVCGLLRRKPKPKPLGPCDVLGTGGAFWTMFGMGAAGLIKTLQNKETKMIDMTAGTCPRCGGRLYVDTQYPDETHCDTCNYPEPDEEDEP